MKSEVRFALDAAEDDDEEDEDERADIAIDRSESSSLQRPRDTQTLRDNLPI